MRGGIEVRIERLEQEFGEAGCVCGEHKIGAVQVQHDWTKEQMDAAAETAWFTCPVHGYREPETVVLLLRFGR